ncbi:hypothetical protein [Sphingomonas sp. PWP1-2]|uniref:hypothetical protein n=1 Tax=Sphingomonas sp. PWP1-2 TaxID=2804558 RepID=UPI003CF3BC08
MRVTQWDALQWPVEIPATIREGRGCAIDITIVNLSLGGCRVWAGYSLRTGRSGKLVIAKFSPITLDIVESEAWFATFRFDQPIHYSVLDHLRMLYPAGEQPIAQRKGYGGL